MGRTSKEGNFQIERRGSRRGRRSSRHGKMVLGARCSEGRGVTWCGPVQLVWDAVRSAGNGVNG